MEQETLLTRREHDDDDDDDDEFVSDVTRACAAGLHL